MWLECLAICVISAEGLVRIMKMHCPSYIHYAICLTKETANQRSHSIVHPENITPTTSKLVPLSQTFLHPLLHKCGSRPRHRKLPLLNFHVAETEDTRAIARAASRLFVVAVALP